MFFNIKCLACNQGSKSHEKARNVIRGPQRTWSIEADLKITLMLENSNKNTEITVTKMLKDVMEAAGQGALGAARGASATV